MKLLKITTCLCLGCATLTPLQSCDSGDIYPEENLQDTRTITATFSFHHSSTIPTGRERKIALAALASPDDLQPLRLERISSAQDEDPVTITLSSVPADAGTIALVLTNQSSEIMYTFFSRQIAGGTDDLSIEGGDIELASFDRLQAQMFNLSCTSCHTSGNASAGLNLSEGNSYGMIVNKPSYKSDKLIVDPGNPSNSLIIDQLVDYEIGGFHTTLSTLRTEDITLLEVWVNNGAKND